MQRRERTRHLIELGGLVQKSGLVELTDDDRSTLYGAMLDLAARARDEDGGQALTLW
ncbi:MAG: conjugal transfer protein TraD, partial [Parasphingorhabdus sp.]